MRELIDMLEPYTNITDLKIFGYLVNSNCSIEECYENFNSVSKNLDVLYLLADEVKEYNSLRNKNRIIYNELLQDYKSILYKTSKLARELNLKNSLELSVLFTYLMWNGYFSKNRKYKYKQSDEKPIDGFYGLQIMSGIGVCINHSFMLKDFLNMNKVNSSVIEVNTDEENSADICSNYLDLKRIITKRSHAVNLVEENNNLYIYDSTNISLFDIKSSCMVKECGKETFYFINPYSFLSSNYGECFNPKKELFTRKKFISPYNDDDLEQSKSNCMNLVNDNKKLLNDYYQDTKSYILKIAEGIKK